jgi:hypothetical protein
MDSNVDVMVFSLAGFANTPKNAKIWHVRVSKKGYLGNLWYYGTIIYL